MIVENKLNSLEKANDISSKLLSFITEETKNFDCSDDPAEQIYLGCHIAGNLIAKICISLQGYGKIYGINKMTSDFTLQYISSIAKEHIDINSAKEAFK